MHRSYKWNVYYILPSPLNLLNSDIDELTLINNTDYKMGFGQVNVCLTRSVAKRLHILSPPFLCVESHTIRLSLVCY